MQKESSIGGRAAVSDLPYSVTERGCYCSAGDHDLLVQFILPRDPAVIRILDFVLALPQVSLNEVQRIADAITPPASILRKVAARSRSPLCAAN